MPKIAAGPGEKVTRTLAANKIDGPLTINIESGTGRVEVSWRKRKSAPAEPSTYRGTG